MSAALPPSSNLFDCRDAFAAALDQVAERDNRIVIVVNDSIGSSSMPLEGTLLSDSSFVSESESEPVSESHSLGA